MHTHPTPPPPGSPIPARVRAVAQLRPVSIPDIVRGVAGSNPQQQIAAFDRRYMQDGMPAPEASVQGNAEDHRLELKRKADGISRSLSDVFAYLTYNTTSQNEAKKILTIIHNVWKIIINRTKLLYIISIIHVISIMTIICFQLHYSPANIPHSSLRTMAKDVRRAMLPNNDEVLKKSFAEGIEHKHTFKMSMG
jgi:hypothetical protein